MRLKSDEVKILLALNGGSDPGNSISADRVESIFRKFMNFKLIDADGSLTARGELFAKREIEKVHSETPDLESECNSDGDIQSERWDGFSSEADGSIADGNQSSSSNRIDELGQVRSADEIAERSDDDGSGDIFDLPEADRSEELDA